MANEIVYKRIVNRISEIDSTTKQLNFLDTRFYQRNEKYYPSITSVLQCYPKGKYYETWLKEHGMNSDFIAEKAARTGTQVHELIEKYLNGEKLEWLNKDGSNQYELDVWKMVLRFVDFWETCKPTLIHSEINLYSDNYEIAGTCDLVVEINGEIWLLDIKTSNHLQSTYDLQTAAYTVCWNETFGLTPEEKVKRNGIIWLKSSKQKPDSKGIKMQGRGWEIYESPRSIEENWELFKHVYALYKIENPNDKPKFEGYPLTIQIKNINS